MTRTGASAVIADALGSASEQLAEERQADAGEQLDMMPIPTRFEGEKAAETRTKLEHHHAGRGGGRPAGRQNNATQELRRYLLARGADPLVEMMRWSLHTPATLAGELGCTMLEAHREIQRMREWLSQFLHPRLAPTAEDGSVAPFFQMVIGAGIGAGRQAAAGGEAVPPWLADPEVRQALEGEARRLEENQGLSGDATVRRGDEASNAAPQVPENTDESGS